MADSEPKFPLYLSKQTDRLAQNLARVRSLIDLYGFLTDLLAENTSDKPPDASDVLRSAVVLLHASLEDFLRSVASVHLPRADTDFIKRMPLAGKPRIAKYDITDLLPHRGKTIDDVLDESIEKWLNKHSFNHSDDVMDILKKLGMPVHYFAQTYEHLDAMMSRRHRIVHNADRCDDAPEGVNTLTRDEVQMWMDNVQQFMKKALDQLQFVSCDSTGK